VNSKTSDSTPEERAQASGAESSLGVQLRRAREAQNLSLRDVSDQTRISRRYLEAIEADDYKNLPGGIFNRSFVKAFAKTVGLNEADAIRAYERTARAHGESPDDIPTSRQPSRIYTDGEPVRSPLVTIALSILILTIISLGAYAALHWYQRRNESRANQPPPQNRPVTNANQQTITQPTPAPTPAVAAQGLSVQVKAKGEDVWLSTRVDDAPASNGTLKADQVKDLTATDGVTLRFSKSKINAIEVTINGRLAAVPTEAKAGIVEMAFTKENYERLLQHP
jgi:cytoskeleton protein RodZ